MVAPQSIPSRSELIAVAGDATDVDGMERRHAPPRSGNACPIRRGTRGHAAARRDLLRQQYTRRGRHDPYAVRRRPRHRNAFRSPPARRLGARAGAGRRGGDGATRPPVRERSSWPRARRSRRGPSPRAARNGRGSRTRRRRSCWKGNRSTRCCGSSPSRRVCTLERSGPDQTLHGDVPLTVNEALDAATAAAGVTYRIEGDRLIVRGRP